MMIKKLFITISLLVSCAIHAQDLNYITGHWLSYNGDLLTMKWDGTFRRVTDSKTVTGTFKIIGNYLEITKPNDKYTLHFVTGTTNLVITKPKSNQAWLFRKISN